MSIPIYYDLGIDDVGSCVDYLIAEGFWRKVKKAGEEPAPEGHTPEERKKKAVYDARDLLLTGTRNELVRQIEEDGLESKLRDLCAKLWAEIEEECLPHRKRRYE